MNRKENYAPTGKAFEILKAVEKTLLG